MPNVARFRDFVQNFTRLIDETQGDEERVFSRGQPVLSELITQDDWLPAAFAAPGPDRYRQYLLYCDPWERFSVVSFVWGPGQMTPVHDHTVWGMVGMMRGSETCEEFSPDPGKQRLLTGPVHSLKPGDIDFVSPRVGDIHRVSNALADKPSLSIHVYGANIGAVKRHTYAPPDSSGRLFISGYSNDAVPNIWDRSLENPV